MNIVRALAGFLAVSVLVLAFSFYSSRPARSSDHQDSPTVVANPMEDITDTYVFPAPDAPATNVVFVMDFCPLIGAGCPANPTFDPNVLYQIKVATNYGAGDYQEHTVIQMKANSASTNPTFTVYGPARPNEVSTNNTLVGSTGTVSYNTTAVIGSGVQAFVGPRHDPFYFDLAAFFKILPDRSYSNSQKDTSPHTNAKFNSFNFPSSGAPVLDATGASYGTAGGLGCLIATPSDTVQPFNVESFVISVPKALLFPAGQTPGKIGVWATTSTPTGR